MVVTGCNVRPLNGLPLLRRGAGADERTGFENRRALFGYRGFESPPLRQIFSPARSFLLDKPLWHL